MFLIIFTPWVNNQDVYCATALLYKKKTVFLALRYSTGESEFRESAVRLSAALINVRAIGQHFKPKVEMWMESQKLSTPTQDQVFI